ncbi:hypothetical protein BGY98DRAFT_947415 [Russula aff. rugulosa BPL654]|nr:hypothetical protein BGY98DRAFT_947415 [Russula aff. rugulosa BPL654]
MDLNLTPPPSPEPTDGSDSSSQLTGVSAHGIPDPGSQLVSGVTTSSSWLYDTPTAQSPSPSHNSNRPPPHDNLNKDSKRPLSSLGPTDDQPPSAPPLKRPYFSSDTGPSTWAYPPSDPGPSTRPDPPSGPGPSTWADPPSDPGPSARPDPPSGPGPSTWADPPSDPGPSTASSPGPLQHDSEEIFSELFRDRLKRRISGPLSVNAI